MSLLLPNLNGDATLVASGAEGSENAFLMTREEELSRVVQRAAAKTKDKEHEHTKFSVHNISVRMAASGDRKEVQRSLQRKIEECAAWKVRSNHSSRMQQPFFKNATIHPQR
jgi:hypothetical protein